MKVLHSIAELADVPGPVVLAIGVFDGLHLGHRSVLSRALREAERLGGTAVPLSFDPHPARVLRPEQPPLLLTATEHKLRLLAAMGFHNTLLLSFDAALRATSADAFVRSLASAARPLAAVCVGHQWSFGRGREGNLELLARLGAELHFEEIGVPEVEWKGEPVSSTRIRNAVASGDISLASQLLGRGYTVLGEVCHGRALGRTIGFPTANLTLFNEQLPPNGVYAVRGTLLGDDPREAPFCGVANLGHRPTVDGGGTRPSLEVHLFDFAGDLYGRRLEVEFVSFLREEKRFGSLALLQDQIARDASHARELLLH
jgi:riboflavin kinase/FMN adenylyltransferase